MRRIALAATLAAPLLAALSPAASARDYQAGSLHIAQPWSRAVPATATTGVAYMTVANHGEADRLLGGETPAAAAVELHAHSHGADGVMRMERVADVAVPMHGTVNLQPGGLHVMLVGLKAPLKPGTSFPLTLRFERAGAVTVEVAVGAAGAAGPAADPHAGH